MTVGSILSCLTASVTQPSPKLSQASIVTGRAPSIVHIAISTAPVSDPGTMPMRCVSGSRRISRIRSIAVLQPRLAELRRGASGRAISVASFRGPSPAAWRRDRKKNGGARAFARRSVVTISHVVSPYREHAPRWDGVARRRLLETGRGCQSLIVRELVANPVNGVPRSIFRRSRDGVFVRRRFRVALPRLIALAVSLALLLAGCGGGSDASRAPHPKRNRPSRTSSTRELQAWPICARPT